MKNLLFAIALLLLSSCKKEWEPPVIHTANLSLLFDPDSSDVNQAYFYSGGMKLQIRLKVFSNGEQIFNGIRTNQSNYHWGDPLSGIKLEASVEKLSSDTSLHIDNYPLILRIYKDSKVLYSKFGSEHSYSF